MAEYQRPDGPMSATWVQAPPSHSHVSLKPVPIFVSVPPKSTTRWRAASKAKAAPPPGLGPISSFCVHSQRSLILHSPVARSSHTTHSWCHRRAPSAPGEDLFTQVVV